VRAVVLQLLLILLILDVGDVGVYEKRVAFESAFEEQILLLLEVDGFELFEAGGEVSLLLDLGLLHFLAFGLFFGFGLFLPLLLLLVLLLHLLLDGAQVIDVLLAGLAVDDGTGGVEAGFGETLGGVVAYPEFVLGLRGARH